MTHEPKDTAARPADADVGARVLREVLRTPAFREILRVQVNEGQRSAGRDLVRTVLQEDPELWLTLTSAGPRTVNGVVDSLLELGRALSRMPAPLVDAYLGKVLEDLDRAGLRELPVVWAPVLARALPGALNLLADGLAGASEELLALDPELRGEVLRTWLRGLDGARAAAALNGLAVLLIRLRRDHGELLAASNGPDWGTLLRALDLGKLRQAAIATSAFGREGGEALLAEALSDPVVVANLVGALPSLVNDGLGLLTFVVERLDLPDELLASAIFNVLRALDMTAVARLLSGAAQTLNTLHAGSAILGSEEPAFKGVFDELLDGLLADADTGALADAAVALAEDGDMVAAVLARRMTTDPALLEQTLTTAVRLVNTLAGAGLKVLSEAEQVPDATLEEIAARLPAVDGQALGELLAGTLTLARRLHGQLGQDAALREALAQLDWAPLADGALGLAEPASRLALDRAWHRWGNDPRAVGAWLNTRLVRFNQHLAERPHELRDYLSTLLSAIDPGEVRRAARSVGRLVGSALVPLTRDRPLIGTLVSIGWGRRNRPAAAGEDREG